MEEEFIIRLHGNCGIIEKLTKERFQLLENVIQERYENLAKDDNFKVEWQDEEAKDINKG